MPFMLKITIFTSLLLTVILHIVVEAEGNNSSNNNLIVDTRSISIYQSLYSAIEMDSANEVKQFIAFGADINHRYEDEKTPLMLASNMGSIDAIHALLELGANPDLVSVENMTAMDYAKKNGDHLIIAALNINNHATKADPEIILIRKIQFLLGRLGYDAGEVDGDYGKRTKQSLENFTIGTNQTYPAEISNRQVESLKNVFFKQDLKELLPSTDKNTNNTIDKISEEEITTIKAIPLATP